MGVSSDADETALVLPHSDASGVESAPADEPYVYVIYAAADLDENSALVLQLARRGIPISRDDIYDPDIMDLDDSEVVQRLPFADAVLIAWSAAGGLDADIAAKVTSPDILVLASLDGSLSARFPLREYPTVDLSGWTGDPEDSRLDELADALRVALRRSALRRHDQAEAAGNGERPPAPDHGLAVSNSARAVLARGSLARGPTPNASTVLLLTALAYRPAPGGVGTALLDIFERRQNRGRDELLGQLVPWLEEDALFGGLVDDPRFTGLLALAEQCARRVSGTPEIHLRHLLAATVLARQEAADTPPVDADVLTALGTSPAELPRLLLEAVREKRPRDSITEWDKLLSVSLAGGFDRDLVDPNDAIRRDRDDLEHGVWAAILAAVIADEETPLPVSIGLFGEWGAGKSTFMGLLRGEIEALCGEHGYVRDIVQIGFNAWHYTDANLWASLGDEIFHALSKALTPPEKAPQKVKDQAEKLRDDIAEGLVAAQELEVRRKAANRESQRLAKEIQDARKSRRVTARQLASAALSTPEISRQLTTAWRRLGIDDEVTQGELLADELDGIRRQGTAVRAILGQRLTWILAGLCLAALLVALAGAVIPASWAVWLRESGTAGTVILVLGSAATLARRISSGLSTLRSAANRASTAANEKSDRAVKELRQAEARERAAEAELRQVSTSVEELKRELDGLAPGRRLYSFLAERSASEDYAGQLGLVSIIRKDFQHLVRVLDEHRSETHAAGVRRVDRIVLYIDDLDRCQPPQVVEVLQAVHLLLALDLFVVVVGVDPRWLVRSLREQYPGVLADGTRHSMPQNAAEDSVLAPGNGGLVEAVPADYLQKIFNIPFALPAFRSDDMLRLVRRLADGSVPLTAQRTAATPGRTPGAVDSVGGTRHADETRPDEPRADEQLREVPAATEIPAGADVIASRSSGTAATAQGALQQGSATLGGTTAEQAPSVTVPPQRLTEEEILFIGGLGPFIKTPRDGKRLLNVYRILRATERLSPAPAFLGGEYQATAMLLAMLTLDAQVCARIVDAPSLPGSGVGGGLARRPESESWATFAADLEPRPPEAVPPGEKGLWQNAVVGEIPAAELAAWRRMWVAVEATHRSVTLPDLRAFQAWAPRVCRFSYLVLTQSQ